jgi:hypothetical protein
VKNDRKSMRGGDGVQQCGYAIAITAGINRTCSQIAPARKTRRLSAGAGGRLVLDETDYCGQDRSSDTAACNLTDQGAKVQAASCYPSQRWDEGLEKLSANAAADGAGERVSEGSEIRIFQTGTHGISADGTGNDLDDETDQGCRHNTHSRPCAPSDRR